MSKHEHIDYLEYAAINFDATKEFFTQVFAWKFEHFGEDYMSFDRHGVSGGFYRSELSSRQASGAALAVFYSADLEATLNKVEQHGGDIAKAITPFPGGRRFHFIEPSGNEFAVWSDK